MVGERRDPPRSTWPGKAFAGGQTRIRSGRFGEFVSGTVGEPGRDIRCGPAEQRHRRVVADRVAAGAHPGGEQLRARGQRGRDEHRLECRQTGMSGDRAEQRFGVEQCEQRHGVKLGVGSPRPHSGTSPWAVYCDRFLHRSYCDRSCIGGLGVVGEARGFVVRVADHRVLVAVLRAMLPAKTGPADTPIPKSTRIRPARAVTTERTRQGHERRRRAGDDELPVVPRFRRATVLHRGPGYPNLHHL